MVIFGPFEKVTERFELALLPATSVATALIELVPGVRATLQLTVPLFTVATPPLQVTRSTPESASETAPVATTGEANTLEPFAGELIVKTGGVLSIFTGAEVNVDVFPAASVAVTVPVAAE